MYRYTPLAAIVCGGLFISNGQVNYTGNGSTNFPLGTNGTYSCHPGYSLNGSEAVRTCEQDDQEDTEGVWTGSMPICHRKFVKHTTESENVVMAFVFHFQQLSVRV